MRLPKRQFFYVYILFIYVNKISSLRERVQQMQGLFKFSKWITQDSTADSIKSVRELKKMQLTFKQEEKESTALFINLKA